MNANGCPQFSHRNRRTPTLTFEAQIRGQPSDGLMQVYLVKLDGGRPTSTWNSRRVAAAVSIIAFADRKLTPATKRSFQTVAKTSIRKSPRSAIYQGWRAIRCKAEAFPSFGD